MKNNKSTMRKIMEFITFLAAIVACAAAVMVVPEVRQIFGLDNVNRDSSSASAENIEIFKVQNDNVNPTPTSTIQMQPTAIQVLAQDERDLAAQAIGFSDLDEFINTFEIPTEIKPRIYVCPTEETWCLAVMEEPGKPDFYFRNILDCNIDGKQAIGVSGIPVGYEGMIIGFTVRPCQ